MNIGGKSVLVTGGGRGIGLEIAKAFAKEGARVAICGRNEETLKAAARMIDEDVIYIIADLADSNALEQIATKIADQLGTLDILVNNAGIQLNYSLFERPYAEICQDIVREFKVDLVAPIKLSLALMPMLKASKSGAIVNIGSGLAIAPKTNAAIYCASKAGLRNFTRSLRYQAEQHAKKLRVVDVVLPMVRTDMTAGRGKGKIEPSQVANLIIKGLKKNNQEILIGKARILAVLMRLAPKLGYRILKTAPVSPYPLMRKETL